jgi:hypothetical protein
VTPQDAADRVCAYLMDHPGSTAIDVARGVFGGTGATKTSARTNAHNALRKLAADGRAESIPGETLAASRRWKVRP